MKVNTMIRHIKYLSFFIVFTLTLFFASANAAVNSHYVIFIDAGSSGSRLYLFQYDTTKAVPDIKSVFSASVKTGLSNFADHPELAGESLKKLFDDASTYLNNNHVNPADVPVSILATAGMRLIPEAKQQAVYQALQTYLTTAYSFPVREVKTISGQMEALYGWLDVNYLSRTLQDHQPTLGSADVGGASTEIAFVTHDASVDPADIVSVTIDQVTYPVFSISYLGLGQDQARDVMNKLQNAAVCYPLQYVINNTSTGNFNMDTCGEMYQDIIQKKITKPIPATMGTSFIAYSGIYFDYNFFNADTQPDHYTFEDHIQKTCSKTWSQLKQGYPDVPEKYLATDCANGVYIDQLIYNDYFITDEQLKVVNQINGQEIDWVLGAAVYSLIK